MNNLPRFGAKSIEFQIRRMGDYAFMLHDYDVALQTYKMVSSDFRNNKKAMKLFGGILEIMGICTFLTNGPKKEVELNLDNAVAVSWGKKKWRRDILYAKLKTNNNNNNNNNNNDRNTNSNISRQTSLLMRSDRLFFLHLFTGPNSISERQPKYTSAFQRSKGSISSCPLCS